MTPLSPARKSAEEFASVVDGTRSDIDGRFAELVATVSTLRAQDVPGPRPDFVANLRERLMEAADTLLVPADDQAPATVIAFPGEVRRQRRQRRLSIAAAAFVVVGGTAGVAAAAESALPGDPLYPIKRGIESAQISFSSSDSGRGQDLMRQASTRLAEVHGLIQDNRSADEIKSTLAAFQSSATDGADLIFVSYQRGGDPNDISGLRAMLGSQLATLNQLASTAPAGTDSSFVQARSLIADLDKQAHVLCGDCGSSTTLSSPQITSAPALMGLLVKPAERAQAAAAQTSATSSLAELANRIAQHTPQVTPTEPPAKSTTGTPTSGLPLPTTSTPTTHPVTGTVSNTVSGVTGLINQVTSGTAKPLTDSVTTTLDTLLGLLQTKP